MVFFFIYWDLMLADEILDNSCNPIFDRVLYKATISFNDSMAALSVKAQLNTSFPSKGVLCLIAIVPGICHADGWMDDDTLYFPNPFHIVSYQLGFIFQLLLVIHLLDLASSTLICDGTGRVDTMGGGVNHPLQPPYGVAILHLYYSRFDPIPWNGLIHKDGEVIIPPDPFTPMTQSMYVYCIDFVLFNRNFFIPVSYTHLDVYKRQAQGLETLYL